MNEKYDGGAVGASSMRPLPRLATRQHRNLRDLNVSPARIAAIKAASPVADVIGQHVNLRRQAANYYGRCPWHSSKSGRSFEVRPERGTWRCYGGCGSGDVFAFVRKFFNLTFPDAVIYLILRNEIDLNPAQSVTTK